MKLKNKYVFLSASFPEEGVKWASDFGASINPLKTTSAVKAIANAIFLKGGKLVFGGHPTITPLILNVGKKYQARVLEKGESPFIKIYQSEYFKDLIIDEVSKLETAKIGEIHWTKAINGDREASLLEMRKKMIEENDPVFCVLMGGKDGIIEEFNIFHETYPKRKVYPFGTTGGASRQLLKSRRALLENLGIPEQLLQQLNQNFSYPLMAELVIGDYLKRLRPG